METIISLEPTSRNLDEVFASQGLAVCLWQKDGQVKNQDENCKKYCGAFEGRQCREGCLKFFAEQLPSRRMREGMHVFEGKEINGRSFDIVMIKNRDSVVSLLRPVQSDVNQVIAGLNAGDLTPRENEIFRMRATQRISVTEIAKNLGISRATVRTHINNINKKLKASFQTP